jgi:hypothetical protein
VVLLSWPWPPEGGSNGHVHIGRVWQRDQRSFLLTGLFQGPACIDLHRPTSIRIHLFSSYPSSAVPARLLSSTFTFRVGRSPSALAFTFHIRPCGSTELAQSSETCSEGYQAIEQTKSSNHTILLACRPIVRNVFATTLTFWHKHLSTFRY